MRKNFTIEGFADLCVGGRRIDVHNGYRLTSARTDPSAGTVEIVFEGDRALPWWIEGSPDRFKLVCSGNAGVMFNDLALFPPPSLQGGVEIGYFPHGVSEEWLWLQDEDQIGEAGEFGLHIALSGTPAEDFVLRVQCEAVEAILL
jgi:hypothetical protein